MRYQAYQPPSEFASWIKLLWVFECRSNDPAPETIVTDGFPGRVNIVRSFGESIDVAHFSKTSTPVQFRFDPMSKQLTFLATALALLLTVGSTMAASLKDEKLRSLDGKWIFVDDRNSWREAKNGGAPINMRFSLRVGKDAVINPRKRSEERIALDGSVIESKDPNGSIARTRGEWNEKNSSLVYTPERFRATDKKPTYVLKRVFQIAEEGLLAHVTFDQKKAKVGLYRHPEDIELPEPAKATIADLEWLADAWTGQKHDYPQRIVYGLSKDGALTASVGFAKGALVSSRFKRESK